jgi:flagellar hook-associated protein 1 FlgK
MGRLNAIASQIVNTVNERHRAAFDQAGVQGLDFFGGNSAATMKLAAGLVDHPELVAVAAAANSPADGRAGLGIAGLAQEKPFGYDNSVAKGYSALVGQVGLAAEKAEQLGSRQEELMSFLNGRRQDIAGVSLDDEAVKMLGAQRAFQAASRVITTIDQMLDKLINDTGIVGR